jgi:hypothetical protein
MTLTTKNLIFYTSLGLTLRNDVHKVQQQKEKKLNHFNTTITLSNKLQTTFNYFLTNCQCQVCQVCRSSTCQGVKILMHVGLFYIYMCSLWISTYCIGTISRYMLIGHILTWYFFLCHLVCWIAMGYIFLCLLYIDFSFIWNY